MIKDKVSKKILYHFYEGLDEGALDKLSDSERSSVEAAVLRMGGRAEHKVDIRFTFPFFFQRFYLVFLFGKDLRRTKREESKFKALIMSFILFLLFSTMFSSLVLVLYLIKSALGIDIFKHFSFGVWDWFKNLMGIR